MQISLQFSIATLASTTACVLLLASSSRADAASIRNLSGTSSDVLDRSAFDEAGISLPDETTFHIAASGLEGLPNLLTWDALLPTTAATDQGCNQRWILDQIEANIYTIRASHEEGNAYLSLNSGDQGNLFVGFSDTVNDRSRWVIPTLERPGGGSIRSEFTDAIGPRYLVAAETRLDGLLVLSRTCRRGDSLCRDRRPTQWVLSEAPECDN